LTHPKIKYARMVEGVKHDVRKYLKRERKRALPEEADFWDFDCKFGDTEAEARAIHVAEIDTCIDEAVAKQRTSFYVEILAKPGHRTKKSDAAAGHAHAEAASEAPKKIVLPQFKTFSSIRDSDTEN
jgi:hypothetical protein